MAIREVIFRGKRVDNGEWVEGDLLQIKYYNKPIVECKIMPQTPVSSAYPVIPETVGQFTGLTDKNGVKIFEGDIVRYNTYDDFDCQSVVKFGEYNQDGSAGEYSASKCIGFYVDVDNFTCPDWCEYGSNCFSNYLKQQNILEVAQYCEIIGNIHDNPELLE